MHSPLFSQAQTYVCYWPTSSCGLIISWQFKQIKGLDWIPIVEPVFGACLKHLHRGVDFLHGDSIVRLSLQWLTTSCFSQWNYSMDNPVALTLDYRICTHIWLSKLYYWVCKKSVNTFIFGLYKNKMLNMGCDITLCSICEPMPVHLQVKNTLVEV